jgi:hypothetical protein
MLTPCRSRWDVLLMSVEELLWWGARGVVEVPYQVPATGFGCNDILITNLVRSSSSVLADFLRRSVGFSVAVST